MKVGSYISGLRAQNNLVRTSQALSRALERLSSGLRINSARDDATGLAVSVGLESEVRGLGRAALNINETLGYLQSADSLLSTQIDLVQRMRELAVQASNGILSAVERESLDRELQTLLAEFERVANDSQFNGRKLFDGSLESLTTQVGAQKAQSVEVGIDSAQSSDIFTELRGTGAFNFVTSFGSDIEAQGVGDFNKDGRDDIVTVDGSSVSIHLAEASGDFRISQTFTTTAGVLNARTLEIGDLNGDGILDLIMGDSAIQSANSIYFGSGNGTFSFKQTFAGDFADIEVADFNGDGLDDILGAEFSANEMRLFYGTSHGISSAPTIANLTSASVDFFGYLNVINGYSALESGDFNGDGRLDFVFTDGSWEETMTQSGTGLFSTFYADNAPSPGVAVGDVNEDGFSDLIRTDGVEMIVTPFNSSGAGPKINLGTDASFWIDAADYNNDDHLDLILTDSDQILFGNGRGAFSSQSLGLDLTSISTGDFNGDGVLDVSEIVDMDIYQGVGRVESAVDELDLTTQSRSQNVLAILDNALQNLNSRRSEIGSSVGRLESAANSNRMLTENLKASLSQLRDADIAEETAELTRAQILQQAQVVSLSQANLNMQTVLLLLK